MSTPGLALHNLRTVVIVIVLAVHAVIAYLGSSPAFSFNFDDPPYRWRSIPIVDPERWFGFNIFCAFQDVYLISLLFFLSGLFVWPSLVRSGSRIFLRDRLLRIGVPFALTVGLLMPLAHYPVYFLAGGGIGAYGIECGLLATDGWLVRRWAAAGVAAMVSFALWLGIAGLAMAGDGPPPLAVQILEALSFVTCCSAGVLF